MGRGTLSAALWLSWLLMVHGATFLLSNCDSITYDDAYITMTQDLPSSGGSCLVLGNNVVVDGHGYSITNVDTGTGITVHGANVTIMNLRISGGI